MSNLLLRPVEVLSEDDTSTLPRSFTGDTLPCPITVSNLMEWRMFDLILANGTLIDGTGEKRRRADIGISGDQIAAIDTDLSASNARQCLDISGRIVCPGFVDVHNHSDAWLLKTKNLEPKTAQGFTTEVIMADGISYAPMDAGTAPHWIYYLRSLNALNFEEYDGWTGVGEYLDKLDRRSAQNVISHLPYANVKAMAAGWGRQVPDDFQMERMRADVLRGMEEGAVGVSTGIDYIGQCFSTTDEIVEACEPMARFGGLYVTHVRYRKTTLGGVKEAVEIGQRAGVPVHISHLKGTTAEMTDELFDYIDNTARKQVDFSYDVYPYLPGSTMLNFLLPYDVWEQGPLGVLPHLTDPHVRQEFGRNLANMDLSHIHIAWLPGSDNAHHIGRLLSDYVADTGKAPEDALCDLLIEENLAVLLVFHHGDDRLIHPWLAHDCYLMGTDGIHFPDGKVHPRMYGSAPRVLGPCVRDDKLFTLEEAVAKLSDRPARRFGCKNRGQLQQGWFADVVVFDEETIADRATYEDPRQLPDGIDHVFVNGVPVIREGRAVDDLLDPPPGRALRFNQ